jgi:hypothetical protein
MSSSQSHSRRSQRPTGTDPSDALTQTPPTTKYSSADAAYEQALIDAGIYPYGYDYSDDDDPPIPNNVEEIRERLGQPRPSLSPSRFATEDFKNFEKENMRARTEADVMRNVFPIFEGRHSVPYGSERRFNNFAPLADNLKVVQPDYYNGSRPSQIDPQVRKDLSKQIMPSRKHHTPAFPNNFTEVKGPDGNAPELKRQITADLAYGARGMLKMQSYKQGGDTFDGNAYTLGSTFHSGSGVLTMYAMHPTQPADPDGQPEYHTTQLGSFAMTHNRDACAEGMKWFRNSRDLAKEYRDAAIAGANAMADDEEEATSPADPYLTSFSASTQNELSITSNTTLQDSGSSTDELAQDTHPPRKRSAKSLSSSRRKRPTASSCT